MKAKKIDEIDKIKPGSQDTADLRKRAESQKEAALEALWLSEEKFSYAFRSASYAITITQASDGKIIEVNDGFFAITGYNFKDIAGKTTVELNLWDNESDRNLVVSELAKGKKIAGLEFSFRKKSGERITGLFSAEIISIRNEKCVLSSITDITERKRAEESLKESEVRYRTLFDEALDGTCLADAETGLIIDCNQALADLVGRERAELIGQSQRILHPPYANQAAYSLTFRQHLTDKEGQILETQVVTRAGIIREVEIKANRLNLQGRKMLQGIFRDITERKRAEESLKENEERFRTLYENSTIGLYRTTPDGRIYMANPALIRMLGFSSFDDLSTRNLQKNGFEPSYSRTQFIENIEKDGEVKGLESAWKRKDGTIIFIRESTRAIRDSQAKTLYYDGTVEDITERKRAEEALREANERLLLAIVAGGVGIWDLDVVNNKLTWDDQMFRLYGITPDNFGGAYETWKARVHPEDLERGDAEVQMALRGEKEFDTEFRVVWPSGTIHHIRARARVHRDAAGQPTKLIGTNYDITERKQIEETLRKSEENFRRSLDDSPLGVRVLSTKGKTIYANRQLLDIYGYDNVEELNKIPLKERYTPQSHAEFELRRKVRDRGEFGPTEYEIAIVRKNGEIRHLQVLRKEVLWNGAKEFQAIYQDITERKRAESQREAVLKALRESEEKYRGLFESINDAVFVHDLDEEGLPGRFLQVNDIACRRLGYTREELLSLTPRDITIPEEYERIADKRIGLASQGDILVETIHVTKDGLKIPVESNIRQFQYLDRQVALSISRDITERKRAEIQIQYQANLLANVSDAILATDRQFNIQYWNTAAEKQYGWTAAEVLGSHFLKFIQPQYIADSRTTVIKKIIQEGFWNGELIHNRRNGARFPVQATISEVRNAEDQIIGHITINRDITDRKRAEAIQHIQNKIANAMIKAETLSSFLETVRNELSSLIGTTNFLIALYDEASGLLSAPFEKDAIPQWRAEKSLTGLVIQQKRSILLSREQIRQMFQAGTIELIGTMAEAWLGVPLQINDKVLGAIVVQSYDKADTYDQNSVVVLEIIANQLSVYMERKQAESQREAALEAVRQKAKELQEKNVELECFTYSVSHDLKSPLVTIRTFLGILEQDMAAMDKGKVKQDIGYIRSGAEKMSKLLDELLDLSRIGRSTNPPEEISLQSIVKEASGLVAGRITELGVKVVLAAAEFMLWGDRVRLVEVFQNLLDNACKFMGEQKAPLIEIGVESKDGETVIFVRDNGMGITPQFLPKLFIMFEKLNRSSEGDGIGLALAKRIVEVHGGRIWAESEGSGQGTTFYFTLAKTCLQKTKENQ